MQDVFSGLGSCVYFQGLFKEKRSSSAHPRGLVDHAGARDFKLIRPSGLSPATLRLALLCVLVFAFAQTGLAQSGGDPPLSLFRNYFVTGDYVVGGVGLEGLGINGLATGTINIPDTTQCKATGAAACPPVQKGADALAAWLIWITVESSTSAGAGMHGFFNGYPITGTSVGNLNAPVSWSPGGCSGSSQGSKTMVAYIADVLPYMSLDSSGRVQINGSYPVSLTDSGSGGLAAPLTLGASLVVVYRLGSPSGPGAPPAPPLKSIVMYAGAFAPSNNISSSFTQQMVGFYQALGSGADMTQIAGNGQPTKSETVSMNNTPLPSLYGSAPPFPGIYNGSWDNPRWNLDSFNVVHADDALEVTSVSPTKSNGNCVNWGAVIFGTPVPNPDGDALLPVWKQNQGYNSINAANNDYSGPFVALPGATKGEKDVFTEVDWLSNLDGSAGSYLHSHLPKQAALDMVGDAYASQGIHAHFDVGSNYAGNCSTTNPSACPDPYIIQNGTGGNAISEGLFACTDGVTAPLCAFPNAPTVGWKGGFLFTKYTASDAKTGDPLGNFDRGRASSYGYLLSVHAVGIPRTGWAAAGEAPNLQSSAGSVVPTLKSIVVNNGVGTVTLLTPPLLVKPGDASCTDANCDRVTIAGALQTQNQALNGTYQFLSTPSSSCTTTICTTTFTISTPTGATGVANGTYAYSSASGSQFSEPQLGIGYGGPSGTSGHSDLGGPDSAIAFGLWPADDTQGCQADPSVPLASGQAYCIDQTGTVLEQAGTILHERGHGDLETHGGTYYLDSSNPFLPTYGPNCSSNQLSMMNYLFQVRGFPDNLGIVDYSGQTLPDLDETQLNEVNGIGFDLSSKSAAAHYTRWYGPPNALDLQLQKKSGGRFAKTHCDGSPIGPNEPPTVRVDGGSFSNPIDWNNNLIVPDSAEPVAWQDVNFNGSTAALPDAPFKGFNSWFQDANLPPTVPVAQHVDLQQTGAEWSVLGFSGGGGFGFGQGGFGFGQGGFGFGQGGFGFGQGGFGFGQGGFGFGQGGFGFGQGGFGFGQGGFGFGQGGLEQDVDTANSTGDAPAGLTAVSSNKAVVLSWSAPSFGKILRYDVWKATGSFTTSASVLANFKLFSEIGSNNRLPCNPSATGCSLPPLTSFADPNVKNNTTYTYFVTATNVQGAQSGPSSPAVVFVKFTF